LTGRDFKPSEKYFICNYYMIFNRVKNNKEMASELDLSYSAFMRATRRLRETGFVILESKLNTMK